MTAPNIARERHLHDPFAPRRPEFPRARLRRSGLSSEAMDHLNERYDDMAEDQAIRWVQDLRRQSGTVIRSRFTMPEGSPEEVAVALEGLKQSQLRDLAAAEGLTLSGTNDDLRARLTGTEPVTTPEGPGPNSEPGPSDAGNPPVPAPAPSGDPGGSEDTSEAGSGDQGGQDDASEPVAPADGTTSEETAGRGDQVVGEPADGTTGEEPGQVEVTNPDGSSEVVTGEVPASAAVTGDATPAVSTTAEVPAPSPSPPATAELPVTPAAPTPTTGRARPASRRG